jgi:hypothetical protein
LDTLTRIKELASKEFSLDATALDPAAPLDTSRDTLIGGAGNDRLTGGKGGDLVLLNTRKAEGGVDWSGSFVGTSIIFSDNGVLSTLEGDPRFFFDDSETPQAQGTGTEEWGGSP